MFVYQEKEKDKEFITQLLKEKQSHNEQLKKLELEVCIKIMFLFLLFESLNYNDLCIVIKLFSTQ